MCLIFVYVNIWIKKGKMFYGIMCTFEVTEGELKKPTRQKVNLCFFSVAVVIISVGSTENFKFYEIIDFFVCPKSKV